MAKRLHVLFFKMLMRKTYTQLSEEYIMETFVEPVLNEHPNWVFEGLFVDYRRYKARYHSDVFKNMRNRCEDGGIDLIYTETVNKFDCNMEKTFDSIRFFSSMDHPVGIIFEKEMIYSLSQNGQRGLFLLEQSLSIEKNCQRKKNILKPVPVSDSKRDS